MFNRSKILAEATSKLKGDALEKRVERLFKRLGKNNVKRDVSLIDRFGNRSQIDVTYGYFFKRYIECKNYSNSPVPLSDVAKFKEVLSLNGIPHHRGLFITTSDYVPRAKTIGIKIMNGDDLRKMEKWAMKRKVMKNVTTLGIMMGIVGGGYLYVMQHPKDLEKDLRKKWNNIQDKRWWMYQKREVEKMSSKWWDKLKSAFNNR